MCARFKGVYFRKAMSLRNNKKMFKSGHFGTQPQILNESRQCYLKICAYKFERSPGKDLRNNSIHL